MELPQEKRPAENRYIRSRQYDSQVQENVYTEQKSNHTPNAGPRPPERYPYKYKQPDNTVTLNENLMLVRGLTGTFEKILQPLDYQQPPPAKHEQRIKNNGHNRLDRNADWYDNVMPQIQ